MSKPASACALPAQQIGRRPANHIVRINAFYGYSADVLADWCGVHVLTAYGWKNGRRRPSVTAWRLFRLLRDRRVLGDEWHGWSVQAGRLIDPDGNEFTQGQLRAYYLALQLFCELVSKRPDLRREYDQIMKMAG